MNKLTKKKAKIRVVEQFAEDVKTAIVEAIEDGLDLDDEGEVSVKELFDNAVEIYAAQIEEALEENSLDDDESESKTGTDWN